MGEMRPSLYYFMMQKKKTPNKYPRHFGIGIKQHVLYRENKCRLCGQEIKKLEIYHLFSRDETGVCYDANLPVAFVQSPDNATLMCRKCYFHFSHILQFFNNKIAKPNQTYNPIKCYICNKIASNVEHYINTLSEWKISYCSTCYKNINNVLEFMSSKSSVLQIHIKE